MTALATNQAPPPPPLPLFSVLANDFVESKQRAMPRSGYPNKLRTAARAWILVFGDHPVDTYKPSSVQEFANKLAELPRNWAVTPRFRDMTYGEVVEMTRAERQALQAGRKPPDRFSQTTGREYLAQVRSIWQHIRADQKVSGDYSAAPVSTPRNAKAKKVRNPIDAESVNTWLRHAVVQKRPDDRFLPLLGLLTGARLGELVFLKGEDVRMVGGHLCLSLIDDTVADLPEEERPLKTEQSRRIIVLHDIIMRTGFPDWAAERRADDWLWPRLHRRAGGVAIVNPAGAASKK